MTRIVLFTRGDASFGSGHLHRTSWLREVLLGQQRLGLSVEVRCMASPLAELFWELHGGGATLDADPVSAFLDSQAVAAPSPTPLVGVLDWLDSTPEQIQALRAAGARIVLLDDYGPAQSEADLTINCLLAPLAAEDQYLGRSRLLSGAPFLQLPPAVIRLRGIGIALHKQLTASRSASARSGEAGAASAPGPVVSIVLSFGGAPRLSQTRLALAALRAAGYSGSVTVMPAPLDLADAEADATSPMTVRYLPADDSFHDLLAGADLAMLAGGLSLYEAAFLGVPAIVLPVVHHQTLTARKLAKAGCCALAAGWETLDGTAADGGQGHPAPAAVDALAGQLHALLADPQARGRMSAAGQQLCDGRGLLRTAELVLELGE